MNKKAILMTVCFCFALAFMLVLGTAEQPRASDGCCHVDCPPAYPGPGGYIGMPDKGACVPDQRCFNNTYTCGPY